MKGQRRKQEYKENVLQIISELDSTDAAQCQDADHDSEHQNSSPDLLSMIHELFHSMECLTGMEFHADQFDRICSQLANLSVDTISQDLEIYLLQTFPLFTNDKVPRTQPKNCTLTRRQSRRAEYAITQRSWKKSPNNCLKYILKGR